MGISLTNSLKSILGVIMIFTIMFAVISFIKNKYPIVELIDFDNDGYFTVVVDERPRDCNDEDSSIYPGAEELLGDGIDQDCNGEDSPFVFDPSEYDKDFQEFKEFQEFRQVDIYLNPTQTPSAISDTTIKEISRQIKTSGKFEKAYLYIKAGVNTENNPLTKIDSVYFYFDSGLTGGHLVKTKSLPIETKTGSTELLYNANEIPVINLPYTDIPKEERVRKLDLLHILNSEDDRYNRVRYLGSFVSTNNFGTILSMRIAYKCKEKSLCSIQLK